MAAWVTEHVIPHEAAVRAWLARTRASQEDIDELIQESYSRLAALESVDHIDRPDAYFFSIARNLLVRRLRRARVVPIEAIAGAKILHIWIDAPVWAIGVALLGALTGVNLMSTRSYGEFEYWFSLMKVLAIVKIGRASCRERV